ncbi:MAG TPA: YbaK/EbsC family protein [Syntrophales bacterium]|nr:YbaK/EbsC family protein [Syntrophales bacterium]
MGVDVSQDIYQAIKDLLQQLKISYDEIEHEPVSSCEESLTFRGQAGWSGASSKCILLKAKGKYYLLVTTAEKEIKARLFKKEFGTKDIRFANREELMEVTGCDPGSVPPFGHRDPSLSFYVDEDIFRAGHFMFNPAIPTKSFRVSIADLRRIYAAVPNPVSTFGEDEHERFVIRKLETSA